MDARKLDFEAGSFDNVLVFGLLHHLNDDDARAVIEGTYRVLKGGERSLHSDRRAVSRPPGTPLPSANRSALS
jgi:SAM-dependent methyltransferase